MNILDHELAWRWTNPAYALLPDDVLAQMQAVSPDEAALLHRQGLALRGTLGLDDNVGVELKQTAGVAAEEVGCWLKQRLVDEAQRVLLSWDSRKALRTCWGVFVTDWSEFCYPASDDLLVFPESAEWLLSYHHAEFFQFARLMVR